MPRRGHRRTARWQTATHLTAAGTGTRALPYGRLRPAGVRGYLLVCRLERARVRRLIRHVIGKILTDIELPLLGLDHGLDGGGGPQAEGMIRLTEGDAVIDRVTNDVRQDLQAAVGRVAKVAVEDGQVGGKRGDVPVQELGQAA